MKSSTWVKDILTFPGEKGEDEYRLLFVGAIPVRGELHGGGVIVSCYTISR